MAATPASPETDTPKKCPIPKDKRIFLGNRKPDKKRIKKLEDHFKAPPWRTYSTAEGKPTSQTDILGAKHCASEAEITAVNLAMYLRRPLLITGAPGAGKTSLAHAVAYELGLGDVLHWPINSRSTLQQGKFDYDAIGRLQQQPGTQGQKSDADKTPEDLARDIGRFITLGPLGAALCLSKPGSPRVLLVDELDKGDIDLPNDLLHVFEEGSFTIPQLARLEGTRPVDVNLPERGTAQITGGKVFCQEFPIVFLTSNGEREFPPAFLRRCLRLDIRAPEPEALKKIVTSRLGDALGNETLATLIQKFTTLRGEGGQGGDKLATDQLLNAVRLVSQQVLTPKDDELETYILRTLTGT